MPVFVDRGNAKSTQETCISTNTSKYETLALKRSLIPVTLI